MTKDELMAKWSDLLTDAGNEIRIVGALKINEPSKLMRDLRLAGYEASGKHPEVLNDGSRLYRRWRLSNEPSEQEKLIAWGIVPSGIEN